MNYWKLYDCSVFQIMGRYSSYNKAKSAKCRLIDDTDGDCDTVITKHTCKQGNEQKLLDLIDKDQW